MNTKSIPSWAPHGKALQSYWSGNAEAKIGIKMLDGDLNWMPISIYFRAKDEMPGVESFALALCEGTVLDVGAGAGAHCLALQEEDVEVVGLDIVPEAVEIMKERNIHQTVCADFLDYIPNKAFDTLLFLMNGIGIASTLEGLSKYLQHAHSMTHENSQILLDSADLRSNDSNSDSQDHYFGEITYQLVFDDVGGNPYQWLYIDPEMLSKVADKNGWVSQVIYEEEEGSYLARLIKK